MAKKALPAVIDQTALSSATPNELAVIEAEMHSRQQEVLAQYGGGGPYIREVYVTEIRRDLARTVEAILSVGRRLLVMKTMEAHGGWLEGLRQIGLGEDNAQRMMLAARRVAGLPNTATSRYLIEAAGSGSKLFELMTLPDEELHELVDGGDLAGATLGDIAQMTVRELRLKLAEAREEIATKAQRATARETEIDRLTVGLRKARKLYESATPSEQAAELRSHATATTYGIRTSILAVNADAPVASLTQRVAELVAHGQQHQEDHAAFLAGLFAELETALAMVRDQYGIVRQQSAAEADWIKEARAAGEM